MPGVYGKREGAIYAFAVGSVTQSIRQAANDLPDDFAPSLLGAQQMNQINRGKDDRRSEGSASC